jgi:hypothetical protein
VRQQLLLKVLAGLLVGRKPLLKAFGEKQVKKKRGVICNGHDIA